MKPHSHSQRGFTLIEVLVGLGIGLVGIVVMFRMVALWETHTRSATSGSDTQVSGTLAMYSLERDLRQSGMGFGNADAPYMGCAITAQNTGAPIINANTGNPMAFVPVRIIPGPAGAADQIEVLYGDSSFYGGNAPAPDPSLPAAVLRKDLMFKSSTAVTKTLERRGMFRPGDLAVVAGNETAAPASATCHLIEVTDTANPDNLTIGHGSVNYASFYSVAPVAPRFNPGGGTGAVFASGRIYNLGPNPQWNIWTVRADGTLTRSDAIHPAAPVDVAERVVNMKAEYGVDTNADRLPDAWTAVPPADWTTVLAVRTALLVRSRQYESSVDPTTNVAFAVTPTAQNPCWADCAGAHRFVMTNVDGTADAFNDATPDVNNWRYYRYRVYERIVPIRNMYWGDGAMNVFSRDGRRHVRRGQAGIVMWVALVVLIVMSLAGLAMMRQMGTGISVAGNIAFKQNATSTADSGTEAARLWTINTGRLTPVVLEADAPAQGYYATWNGTWGPTVDPTQFNWATGAATAAVGAGAADTAMGNTSQYIIQRLCRDPGSVQAATQVCSDLEDDQSRDHGAPNPYSPSFPPSFKPYFRVTTRVVGPRNTVSYTQVILN